MKHTFIIFCFLAGLTVVSYSQVLQSARWEHEIKYSEDSYSIVSMRQNGLALVRDLESYESGKLKWEVILLDTTLQQTWSSILLAEDDYDFRGYEYTANHLTLMFRKRDIEILKVQVFDITLSTKQILEYKTELNLQIRLSHYTVADGNSVFGGYVGQDPVLVIFDPIKNKNIVVPGFFLVEAELLDVRPNHNGTFNILMVQQVQGREKLIFRTFDRNGTSLVDDEILIDEEKTILSGASSVLQHDDVLIGGTYAIKKNRMASGVFSCMVDPFEEQAVQYAEFPQLQHFLDYLPDRKAKKIRQRSADGKNYGHKAEFKTSAGIHRIEEFDGGFALFGESYFMTTPNTNSSYAYANPYSTPGGRFNPNPYAPFSSRYYTPYPGYRAVAGSSEMRMYQAFAIGFDYQGRRLWDFTMPMDQFKAFGQEQISDFIISRGVPNFLFKDEEVLKFSNHNADTLQVSQPKEIAIRLTNENEEARPADNDDGLVRQWYNRFFYVWGVTNIRDKRQGVANRRVFYVNKIAVY